MSADSQTHSPEEGSEEFFANSCLKPRLSGCMILIPVSKSTHLIHGKSPDPMQIYDLRSVSCFIPNPNYHFYPNEISFELLSQGDNSGLKFYQATWLNQPQGLWQIEHKKDTRYLVHIRLLVKRIWQCIHMTFLWVLYVSSINNHLFQVFSGFLPVSLHSKWFHRDFFRFVSSSIIGFDGKDIEFVTLFSFLFV